MRILHLDSGSEMRGGQWQVLRLVEGLARAGIASVLLARPGSPLLANALAAGRDARPLSFLKVARLARRADVVHAHDARTHTMAALLGAAPLVVSRRVAFPIRSRWKYRRATRYAAVSDFVKRVMNEGGVPESEISVIYDGVPLREPVREGNRVVAPATDDPLKATDVARQAARHAGIDLEFAADLESGLEGAGLFLYLTRSEGLGSAVLVAMSAGIPVIASNIGGLPEIIHHGQNGWLTENAVEPVTAAIQTLLADRALARRLADCGRQTVAQSFSVEHMVESTISLYRQVLAC